MTSRRARRVTGRFAVAWLAAVLLALVLPAGAAHAVDDASIDFSEFSESQLQLLVSVPGTDQIDLTSAQVTIGGEAVTATAEAANQATAVERTTLLLIDTSESMAGERITEARKAALTYLRTVPANVNVGIVTFDNDVAVRQEPTLDREASRAVIADLELELSTVLYQGVTTAVSTLADIEGQTQILLLSDGADSTKAPLPPVVKAVQDSDVRLDVVSLQQGDEGNRALQALATAGGGGVLNAADPAALSAAFADEAAALARQVLITAELPESVTASSANVTVSLEASGEPHTTEAFLAVRQGAAPAPETPVDAGPVKVQQGPFAIPTPVMYGAVAAIGLGVIGIVVGFSSGGRPVQIGIAEHIGAYGATGGKIPKKAKQGSGSLKDSAKQAAEKALSNSASIEDKIANRLEGAGLSLKPSEWVLLQAGIAVGAGVLGLLISGGNPIVMVLAIVLGALGAWVYLGFKRSRRLAAFGTGLAETLQLMSGSLSAGLSLAQSLDTIVREGTEPMTSEFKRVIAETRLGVSLEEALEGVSVRMDSKDFHWVVMAIRIQREVGGNLAELLLTVAGTLREREYLRRHVRALSAEGRLSCWILGGLPPGFLGYLALTKPAYVTPMFTTPVGWLMCLGMAVLLGVGIVWMVKVATVDI